MRLLIDDAEHQLQVLSDARSPAALRHSGGWLHRSDAVRSHHAAISGAYMRMADEAGSGSAGTSAALISGGTRRPIRTVTFAVVKAASLKREIHKQNGPIADLTVTFLERGVTEPTRRRGEHQAVTTVRADAN